MSENCRCVVAPILDEPVTDDGDELGHVVCCDPDRGLCGADLSDDDVLVDQWSADDLVCVVCDDLESQNVACRPGCPIGVNA